MTSSCVLKVSFAGEIRRLRTSLPTFQAAGAEGWLGRLRAEVRNGLSSCTGVAISHDRLVLKYRTADNDLHLLTESTCDEYLDLATSSNEGDLLLRLVVEDSGFANLSKSASPPECRDALLTVSEESRALKFRTAELLDNPESAAAVKLLEEHQAVHTAITMASVHKKTDASDSKGEASLPTDEEAVSQGCSTHPSCAASKRKSGVLLWASLDGKATISNIDTPHKGRQPQLTLGKSGPAFCVRVKLGKTADEASFDGSPEHASVMEDALEAVRLVAPGMACTPGWHSVALKDGRSLALQLCLEYQLHLCLKPWPSRTRQQRS